MRRDEVVGWGDLAGETVAQGAGHVEDVHRAVARRVFGLVGPLTGGASLPVGLLHDGISAMAYAAVRHGGRSAGRVLGRIAAVTRPEDAPAGWRAPRATSAQSTVVGLVGDRLTAAGNAVAWPLGLRCSGQDVAVGTRGLRDAYPAATGRLVVFVHGLFETDRAWAYGASRWWSEHDTTLPDRLVGDGWTPLVVRYPTSQPLAENGRELADLVRRVTATWPVPVEEVAFVGHSMGGLLARHAVHVASTDGHDWLPRCRRVVCLGAPHGGSPVARLAATAADLLGRLPETRGIGDVLDLRSPGIRDLERTPAVPDVDGVEVHLVAALVSRSRSRVAREVVGDLLVGEASAGGRASDGTRLRVATHATLIGLHHFDLLNHPAVDVHVRQLLADQVGAVAMSTTSGRTTAT